MSAYEIYIEQRAERDLKRLPPEEFERIIANIKTLSTTPRPAGCRKIVGSKRDWRIRVGEYRVIYEIDDEKRAIMIMRVRHRKEAYR